MGLTTEPREKEAGPTQGDQKNTISDENQLKINTLRYKLSYSKWTLVTGIANSVFIVKGTGQIFEITF